MKYLLLIAVVLPAIALSQNSQTDCVNTPPIMSCTTTGTPPAPQVNAPDVIGAYQRGAQMAAQRQALERQAELAAERQRNLQLQNEILRQQIEDRTAARTSEYLLEAETAAVRRAYAQIYAEQKKLPEGERLSPDALTARVVEKSSADIGHRPSDMAMAQAAVQCLLGCGDK
jgi:hypothetical protein